MSGGSSDGAVDRSALARVRALTISFPGQAAPAVDGVSLEVCSGECVALVGESGSGKSLTARAILGLLPETARMTAAVLEVDGSVAPPPGARGWNAIRGLRAGLVPQDALGGLDPLRRVEHEVGDALRLHGLASGRARQDRVVAALQAAGVPEPEERLPQRSDELSGGLRQRTLLASALITDPQLIVADEPTTALDASHRGRVLDALRTRVEAGAGVLLITHDLASVRGIADRVLVMRGGRIIEAGPPARVLDAPEHPFTRELLAASPAGAPRGTRLLGSGPTAGGAIPAATAAPQAPGARSTAADLRNGGATPSAAPRPPRLELTGIDVALGRGAAARRVLAGASLSVAAGETVGLLGESGSGKTTLLRVALGLLSPDTGSVRIDGVDRASAGRAARRELRRRIAFVPQDPLDSFPTGATGRRILLDALRAARVPRPERRDRARGLAAEVGLSEDLLARPALSLSGGQRQRIAIARALARGPEILLLDEPVSALDVTVQARVLDLLDELQASRGTAYLLVSHDTDVIRHMSDRVLRLAGGAVSAV